MLKQQLLLMILFAFSACSTKNIQLSDANQMGIPEFSMDKQVEMDGGVFYKKRLKIDSLYNRGLGTVPNCLNNVDFTIMKSLCIAMDNDARNAYKPPESIELEVVKLDAYQKQHGIDLKTIVSSEFTQQIQQLARFNGKINQNAKAQFKVAILKYGLEEVLATPGSFSPVLLVQATLIDANGDVLWEQTQSVDDADVPKFTYSDYYAQPENFQKAWAVAAKVVVNKLISEMD
jgi:hypothetical protein